jgi:hypothetical protein
VARKCDILNDLFSLLYTLVFRIEKITACGLKGQSHSRAASRFHSKWREKEITHSIRRRKQLEGSNYFWIVLVRYHSSETDLRGDDNILPPWWLIMVAGVSALSSSNGAPIYQHRFKSSSLIIQGIVKSKPDLLYQKIHGRAECKKKGNTSANVSTRFVIRIVFRSPLSITRFLCRIAKENRCFGSPVYIDRRRQSRRVGQRVIHKREHPLKQ